MSDPPGASEHKLTISAHRLVVTLRDGDERET